MAVTFTTTLRQAASKNATGISVPKEIVEALSSQKSPLVKVTVNDYTYRGKIAVYGGENLIGFSAEHRAASKIEPGDSIEVTLELETEPREIEMPEDLVLALAEKGLTAKFEKTAPSRKKEFVRQVNEAKTAETRERRISKVIESLI